MKKYAVTIAVFCAIWLGCNMFYTYMASGEFLFRLNPPGGEDFRRLGIIIMNAPFYGIAWLIFGSTCVSEVCAVAGAGIFWGSVMWLIHFPISRLVNTCAMGKRVQATVAWTLSLLATVPFIVGAVMISLNGVW